MTSNDQIDAVKSAARAVWALGDYQQVATRQLPVAESLCAFAGVTGDDRVLDVGTATGNVAITAARRGAAVSAVDITPRMLELAQERVVDLDIDFRLGDAEDLPFVDRTFDVVLSACGAWFAPRPDVMVAEAMRVLRPGGRIAFANFTPTGYFGKINELITNRIPLPAGVPEPNLWGIADIARQRLSRCTSLETRTEMLVYEFPSTVAASEFFFRYSPPHVAVAAELDRDTLASLLDEIERYTAAEVQTGDGVRIVAEYLLVKGIVP